MRRRLVAILGSILLLQTLVIPTQAAEKTCLPIPDCPDQSAERIQMIQSLPIENRIVMSSSLFETNPKGLGFSDVMGNSDGAGLSFGIIQFNLQSGDLQSLMKEYIQKYPDEYKQIFGNKANQFSAVINNPNVAQRIRWGHSISTSRDLRKIQPEWERVFTKLGESPHIRDLQFKHAREYYLPATLVWAKELNIKSSQGVAFLFDHKLNSGGFKRGNKRVESVTHIATNPTYKNIQSDYDRLGLIKNYIATSSLPITFKKRRQVVSFPMVRRDAIREGCTCYTPSGIRYSREHYGISYQTPYPDL